MKRGLISAADVALCNQDGASGLTNGTGAQVFVNGAVTVRLGDPGTYPTSCASSASPFHAERERSEGARDEVSRCSRHEPTARQYTTLLYPPRPPRLNPPYKRLRQQIVS